MAYSNVTDLCLAHGMGPLDARFATSTFAEYIFFIEHWFYEWIGALIQSFHDHTSRRYLCENNQCMQGPDLVNKLLSVLLRFRQYHYAIMADIESMYLQVRIPPRDRNALRFLWFVNDALTHYRMTSHLFGGVWCASSSTYALRRTAIDVGASDVVRNTIMRSFYVDDLLTSVSDKETASEIINGTQDALKVVVSGWQNLWLVIQNCLAKSRPKIVRRK